MSCGDPSCPRHKNAVCPHGVPDDSVSDVCGYQGAFGICGKDELSGVHVEKYDAESFEKHRFRRGAWVSNG